MVDFEKLSVRIENLKETLDPIARNEVTCYYREKAMSCINEIGITNYSNPMVQIELFHEFMVCTNN